MNRDRLLPFICLLLGGLFFWPSPSAAHYTEGVVRLFEQMERNSQFDVPGTPVKGELSATLEMEYYHFDAPPPGLIETNRNSLVNPRLSLSTDLTFSPRLYGYVLARYDRGFDPSSDNGETRLDEFYLLYIPPIGKQITLKAGQFSSLFGNWIPRHYSWENAFLSAPLPYERILNITDQSVPNSRGDFVDRRDVEDPRSAWPPTIWGPSYTRGVSIERQTSHWHTGLGLKQRALSSRPDSWNEGDFSHPTLTARLAYRPSPLWQAGASFSRGPYLLEEAQSQLPSGRSIGDYDQTVAGVDVRYAHHHLQVWGEAITSRFEVPNVGDVDVYSYYLEARYQLTAGWSAALRWNQQWFEEISDGRGNRVPWDRNGWRVDQAVGYRFSRHVKWKLQFSLNHQNGPVQQGEAFIATSVLSRF